MAQLPKAVSPAPLTNPKPWYVGSNGATTHTRNEMQRRAREILQSADYQRTLLERINDKTLPPAVEIMLHHYAYGKPIEQVQLTVSQGGEDLSSLSTQDLLRRAQEVQKALEEAEALEAAIPTEFKVA